MPNAQIKAIQTVNTFKAKIVASTLQQQWAGDKSVNLLAQVLLLKDQISATTTISQQMVYANQMTIILKEDRNKNATIMKLLELNRFNTDDDLTVLTHQVIDILTQDQ